MNLLLMLAALAPGQPSLPPTKNDGLRTAFDAVERDIHGRLLGRRKQQRDEALKRVGPHALAFCQEYGEQGVNALLNCAPQTGRRIVELHDSGDLSKIPRPDLLVAVIARHGEGAAAFVAERHAELTDPAALEVFCREPEEYVHAMKDLRLQARRRKGQAQSAEPPPPWWKDWRNLALAAAGVGAAGLLLRLRGRRAQTGGA